MTHSRITRQDQIADLFAREADRLIAIVSHKVRAPRETVEDGCSYAWLQLVRHDEVEPDQAMPWLVVVATREAIALRKRNDYRAPLALTDEPIDAPAAVNVEDEVITREDLALVEQLHPMQRQAITAKYIVGLSAEQACEALGVTPTWLNRHLYEGRRAIRKLRGQ